MSARTIELKEEAIPLVKSSLYLKRNLLKTKLEHYIQELKTFEQRYKMSSQTFYQKFNEGILGDDKAWFKWTYLYETFTTLEKELEILKGIRL